jgi:5'-nucleotidase
MYFRDNVKLTLNMLNENNVPLLIFSAGIGDLINEVLEKYEVTFPNIKVVSNFMKFNNKGVICGFTEPIIHMFNKNRNILSGESLSYFVDLAHRVNALLLGDSLGDVQMDTGLENPGAILKIGFLNDNVCGEDTYI